MAYLPQHKILFAGDVAFFWVAPCANNSYITKWLETCDKIAGWDVDVIVARPRAHREARRSSPRWPNYFRVLGVEARKRHDAKMTAGAAAAGNPARPVRQLGWPRAPHHGHRPLVPRSGKGR